MAQLHRFRTYVHGFVFASHPIDHARLVPYDVHLLGKCIRRMVPLNNIFKMAI